VHRTREDAANALGIGLGALDHACRTYGLKPSALLARPAPSLGGAASYVDPGPEEPESPAPLRLDWTGARPATDSVTERRLIIGDMHIPFHHLVACAVVLSLIRLIQPRRVVQMGDLFNMGAVSHHPRPLGGRENHCRALVQGQAFLEAARRASPGSEWIILLGNHDDWAEEYEDEHPEFSGLIRPPWLERIGATVVPREQQPYRIGPVAYQHGYGGGEAYAKKYAVDDGPQAGVRYIKVGHHHSMQRFHAKNGVECCGAGWLGDSRHNAFRFMKNARGWEVGVLIEDIVGDHVTTTPVRIVDGRALFGGRIVEARAA
jgi:hypothetical protein